MQMQSYLETQDKSQSQLEASLTVYLLKLNCMLTRLLYHFLQNTGQTKVHLYFLHRWYHFLVLKSNFQAWVQIYFFVNAQQVHELHTSLANRVLICQIDLA